MFIGSNNVSESVVMDTGSGWLTVPLSNCSDCKNKDYDPSNSSTGIWSNQGKSSLSVILLFYLTLLNSMAQLT
jgi:hypothetical protein